MNKVFYLIIFLFFYSCEPEKEEQKSNNDVYGCMDGEAINFLNSATIDDGSCEYLGCTDPEAANFDSAATIDNGNCLGIITLQKRPISLVWIKTFWQFTMKKNGMTILNH